MVTLKFILSRILLIISILPLLTVKKIINLLTAIFFFLVKSNRTVKHPPILILTLTNRCNYSCIMCLKSSSTTKTLFDYGNPKDMDFKYLEEVLTEHADYLCFVRLHGGEPIYYQNIEKLLDLLNHLKIPYNLVTNGSLLTDAINTKLVNSFCFGVGISIDAATQETYEMIRKDGDHKVLTSNIESLNTLKNTLRSRRPTLSASMCTFSFNAHEISGLVEYCSKHRIPSLTVAEGWDYQTDHVGPENLVENNAAATLKALADARQEAKQRGIKLRMRFPSLSGIGKKERLNFSKIVQPKNCLNLYASVWLLPDFNAIGCSSVSASFGNIQEHGLRTIWNSEMFEYAKSRVNLKRKKVPSHCGKCIYTGGFFS